MAKRDQPSASAIRDGASTSNTSRRIALTDPRLGKGTSEDVRRVTDGMSPIERPRGPDPQTASLATNVRTPLSIIRHEASLLEQRLGSGASMAELRSLERIALNAEYIDRLLCGVLDLASAEAGKLELQFTRVDLAALVEYTVQRAVSSWDRKRVHIDIRDALSVSGDATRLERVVASLVSNAIRYGLPGGAVTVRLEQRGTYACISVVDVGPGLTAEQARTVFSPFDRTGNSGHHGYGLGLFICRQIIGAHGGRIGVNSTPGKSTRFFFELPVILAPSAV